METLPANKTPPPPHLLVPLPFSSHLDLPRPLLLQVVQGLDWVRQNASKPAVVVMALGGSGQYLLDAAVRNLALSGTAVLVAAGNEDADACTKSPAR